MLDEQLTGLRELNKKVLGLADKPGKGNIDTVMVTSDEELGLAACWRPYGAYEVGVVAQDAGDCGIGADLAVVFTARAAAPLAFLDLVGDAVEDLCGLVQPGARDGRAVIVQLCDGRADLIRVHTVPGPVGEHILHLVYAALATRAPTAACPSTRARGPAAGGCCLPASALITGLPDPAALVSSEEAPLPHRPERAMIK
ncbi:hypothetical protein [Streptomyces noursei]|uniref:hypothetical protein n=1 Tax=Streptomyces noursei TaxID=1971 RepID=UPI0037FB4B7B